MEIEVTVGRVKFLLFLVAALIFGLGYCVGYLVFTN